MKKGMRAKISAGWPDVTQTLHVLMLLILALLLTGCTVASEAPSLSVSDKSVPVSSGANTGNISKYDSTGQAETKRCVGYFTSWSAYARGLSVKDIDPRLLTHINFAFASLSETGELQPGDSWADLEKEYAGGVKGHYAMLRKLKESNPSVRVLVSVGGWTWSGNFSAVAADAQKRKRFASSAVDFVVRYGLDGVDIDWEYPVEGGNGIPHSPDDRKNYTLLLQEVREAFDRQSRTDGKNYLLSIAGGANVSFTRNTELSAMMEYVDFINIMAYDYHGAWDSVSGHHSPLYAKDGLSVSDSVEAYLAAGARPEKLNLGLAFYGRGWQIQDCENHGLGRPGTGLYGTGYGQGTWEGGVFDAWDLYENYAGKNGYVRWFDSAAGVPCLSNGTTFISYEDQESIRLKLEYADSKQLGGVMFWEFSGDKKKELQGLIAEYQLKGIPQQSGQQSGQQQSASTQSSVSELPAWNEKSVYTGGERVTYDGKTYQARWWTQGENPALHHKEWDVWEDINESK